MKPPIKEVGEGMKSVFIHFLIGEQMIRINCKIRLKI